MNLSIKKLEFKDFRKFRDFTINFDESVNDIYGENASGKTTILDAIYWVLFGKDSLGRTKFDLYPLDLDKNIIEGTTPRVIMTTNIDGEETVFSRESSASTKLSINGIPKKVKEYSEYISNIIDEKMFMALINPTYFGGNFEWKEQRDLILGHYTVQDTIITKTEFAKVKTDILTYGSSDSNAKYSEIVKSLDKSITKSKGSREYIISSLDGKKIGSDQQELISKRDSIQSELDSFINGIDSQFEIKKELADLVLKNNRRESEKDMKVVSIQNDIKKKSLEKSKLLSEYKEVASSLNLGTNLICKECGAPIDSSKLDEKLLNIKALGTSVSLEMSNMEAEVDKIESEFSNDNSLSEKISKLEEKIKSNSNENKIQELRASLQECNSLISNFENIIKLNEDLEATNAKIKKEEIEKEDAEIKVALIKKYGQEYARLLSDNLNNEFESIRINTISVQKNGDEIETFEITLNGVPYKSLNSAGKVEAGIELILLLNKILDIRLPIIIDNKESVTKTFKIPNQLITLTVKKGAELGV